MNTLDTYLPAYDTNFKFNDENILMLSRYVERIVGSLECSEDVSLLSLGIGHRVVASRLFSLLGKSIARYQIVEGSKAIIDRFLSENSLPSETQIHQDFFESFQPDKIVDAIEMGFVLEHVNDPKMILSQYKEYLAPNGRIFLAVPNALSLHRRVGNKSGLLEDMYALSEHDHQLGHQRFFDLLTLRELVSSCGLHVEAEEGIYLKPITTSQMQQLNLSTDIYQAFCDVGTELPELCNAIYMEVSV